MHTWVCRNCRGCAKQVAHPCQGMKSVQWCTGCGVTMRLTLEQEIEFAIWKITGIPCHYHKDLVPQISRMIAEKTGEDPGEVSMALISQIKEIIRDDVSHHFRRAQVGSTTSNSCQPAEGMCYE